MYLDSTAAGVFLFFHRAMNFNYEFNVRKIQSILEFILHLNIDESKNGLFQMHLFNDSLKMVLVSRRLDILSDRVCSDPLIENLELILII